MSLTNPEKSDDFLSAGASMSASTMNFAKKRRKRTNLDANQRIAVRFFVHLFKFSAVYVQKVIRETLFHVNPICFSAGRRVRQGPAPSVHEDNGDRRLAEPRSRRNTFHPFYSFPSYQRSKIKSTVSQVVRVWFCNRRQKMRKQEDERITLASAANALLGFSGGAGAGGDGGKAAATV